MTYPLPALPPSDPDSERALLGSVLLDPSVLADIAPLPAPGDFYVGAHGALWRVVLALHEQGTPPDALLAFREAERKGLLDAIGGRDAITELAAFVTSPAHAKHYAKTVSEKAELRRLLALARSLEAKVLDGDGAAECLQTAQDGLYALSTSGAPAGAVHISEALYAVLGALEGKRQDGVVPTGYPHLDDLTSGGLYPGQVTVLAARPGCGKTTLALNIAANVAEAGKGVLVYSLEMTSTELARVMLARHSQTPSDRIRKGRPVLGQAGMDAVSASAASLGNLPIWISDRCDVGVCDIRAEAQRIKAKHGLGLLVVDYLGLLATGAADGASRQEDVAALSRGLKVAAKDLGLPVLVLAQLNRQSEQREGGRPRLSDLRDSGQVEADADVVMMLHRPFWYSKAEQDRDMVEVIYTKNRYGPQATLRLIFNENTSTMRSPRVGDFD